MPSNQARLVEYFDGTKQCVIPLYQRAYTWEDEKRKALWQDLLDLYEKISPDQPDIQTHFMGAIISQPTRTVPVGVNKSFIIDGQQRIITISLLLAVLRHHVDSDTGKKIHERYLVNNLENDLDHLKLLPTQEDRFPYREYILKNEMPPRGTVLAKAIQYFEEQLSSGEDCAGEKLDPTRLLSVIEANLMVVPINLDERDDPNVIFECLNYRSEKLKEADLVKNYALMCFRQGSADSEQDRVHSAYWRPLEVALGDGLTEYLFYFARKDGVEVRKSGIYKAIKDHLRRHDPNQVESVLASMLDLSKHYMSIRRPELEQNANVRQGLENLAALKVSTHIPLLLNLFQWRERGQISAVSLSRTLQSIESFIVRRAVCGVPNNALDKMFTVLCKQIQEIAENEREAKVCTWIHKALNSGSNRMRWPNDSEFREALVNTNLYDKDACDFILHRIERSSGTREPADLSRTTIEHVMPRTLTEPWKQSLGDDWASIHSRLCHTLGNLTLTAYNPNLAQKPFKEKREILESSNLWMNREISKCNEWSESEIIRRAESLTEVALRLWVHPIFVLSSAAS